MFVISLGGSIISPDGVDTVFLGAFRDLLVEYHQEIGEPLILVTGGGAPARRYQQAYREIATAADAAGAADADAQDWIGIMATRLNAELLRHTLAPLCQDPVVYDPTGDFPFTGGVLVAAGWKPGFSTDFDAVMLAERFGADTVVNLSNIAQVYTADPRTDKNAQPMEEVSWEEFRAIVGDTWTPGGNLPFDPVATRRAAELGLQVIAAGGTDLRNTRKILWGQEFFGTRIGV